MISAKLLLAYLLQTASVFGIEVDTSKVDLDQAYCLAQNIYYESKSEDIKGQFAVASVTLNRVNDSRYPSTVCEVVKQITVSRETKRPVCQFSWYCEKDKRGNNIPVKNKDGSVNQVAIDQFQVASLVAIAVLGADVEDNTKGATHFHNPFTSSPPWKYELKKTMRVGNHDFYR
jgi:spore germination cell wall hydrolase CwlJ-like protein